MSIPSESITNCDTHHSYTTIGTRNHVYLFWNLVEKSSNIWLARRNKNLIYRFNTYMITIWTIDLVSWKPQSWPKLSYVYVSTTLTLWVFNMNALITAIETLKWKQTKHKIANETEVVNNDLSSVVILCQGINCPPYHAVLGYFSLLTAP